LIEKGLVVFCFETGVLLESLVDKIVVIHGLRNGKVVK
jgi:hypothetical protein